MYKYKINYQGDTYIGNSIDEVAKNISKDPSNNISFTEAVLFVNKNIIPVVHKPRPEAKIGKTEVESVGLSEMANGAKAVLLQTFMDDTVDQLEIDRRALICGECPMVAQVSGCMACGMGKKIKQFGNKVRNWFGSGHRIPSGLEQNYCDVCHCSLAMLLPATMDQIKESTINDPKRPATCWMKR